VFRLDSFVDNNDGEAVQVDPIKPVSKAPMVSALEART